MSVLHDPEPASVARTARRSVPIDDFDEQPLGLGAHAIVVEQPSADMDLATVYPIDPALDREKARDRREAAEVHGYGSGPALGGVGGNGTEDLVEEQCNVAAMHGCARAGVGFRERDRAVGPLVPWCADQRRQHRVTSTWQAPAHPGGNRSVCRQRLESVQDSLDLGRDQRPVSSRDLRSPDTVGEIAGHIEQGRGTAEIFFGRVMRRHPMHRSQGASISEYRAAMAAAMASHRGTLLPLAAGDPAQTPK